MAYFMQEIAKDIMKKYEVRFICPYGDTHPEIRTIEASSYTDAKSQTMTCPNSEDHEMEVDEVIREVED